MKPIHLLRASLHVLIAVFSVGALAAQSAAPPPDPIVKEGVTRKIGEHTYVIMDDNVPLVPNVGIIVGSNATLVIDPGLGRRSGEAVLREVAKVSRNAQVYLATTHFHPEHTTGYIAFPASAKYVNSTVQEAEWVANGMTMTQMFARRSPATAEILKDATGRPADITFDRDYTLDLGGVTVRMLAVGPTHTKGDIGIFIEQDRVLFSGDVVMSQSFLAAGADASMRAWMAAFDAFDAWKPIIVIPAHGGSGDGTLIPANREVMAEIRASAQRLKQQGQGVEAVMKTVTDEMTARHPGWPRANGIGNAARGAFNEAP